jgi:hypothetical protein
MPDDLIDFPCSDLWNNYYADRGLTTTRHSTDPRRPSVAPPSREDELVQRIAVLEARLDTFMKRPRPPRNTLTPRAAPPFRGADHA